MIDRYTSKRMSELWSLEHKYQTWLEVELLATEAWAVLGAVPQEDAVNMRRNARFTVERVAEIEESTRHDVVAFTRCVAESLGGESKYLHYGLTSTDVVDTAMSRSAVQACRYLLEDIREMREILKAQAIRYKQTPIMGRTHGVHAEPTTLGLKFALWYEDMGRNLDRMEHALETIRVGKISGAVGTYANVDPFVEQYVCEHLGLKAAPISTQVLQRDRYAEFLSAVAITGSCLEKIALEIRSLQRTEIREVEEPFRKGQKGSSAMPHKRNPINCEKVCGLSRLLRGYAMTAMEDVALWHERDISHSSVERIILPDATSLLEHMFITMNRILKDLFVYPENMRRSMSMSYDLPYSQQVLLTLIGSGMLRETAYDLVQKCAMQAWEGQVSFRQLILENEEIRKHLSQEQINACFELSHHLRHVDEIYHRLGLE